MKGGVIELGASEEKNIAMVSRGISVLDFILRVIAIAATLASAIAMASTDETLPFVSRFIKFKAKFNDLPTFTFFVAANSVVCAYLILSLALSIISIVRSKAQGSRVVLMYMDTAMMALLTSGASAAAAIVYLAHKGNTTTNWFSICRQFNSFCDQISGALIGSFGGVVILVVLILLSATALARR